MLIDFQRLLDNARKSGQQSVKLTDQQLRAMFPEISTLFNYNMDLLQRLQTRLDHWSFQQRIGDILLQTIPFLKSYVNYVNAYPAALALVKQQCEEQEAFRRVIELGLKDDRCKRHNVGNCL